jgi:hypothetical protein
MRERYLFQMSRQLSSSKAVHLAILCLVSCVMLSARVSIAQTTVELKVKIDAGPRMPVNGALVALIDDSGKTVTEALSPESGRTVLRAAPGSYRIRVRRIGFRPFYSQAVTLPRSDEIVLNIETPRVVLDAIVVSASSQCGEITRDAQALGAVWEEIEKALKSSELSVTDLAELGRSQIYLREVSDRGTIIRNDTSASTPVKLRPFGAKDAASLAAYGYVLGNPTSGWDFFAPDEKVLLSNEFTATHCFHLVRDKKRKGDIGVAFSPAPKRRIPDIEGVLWVDENTSELREMRFHYVNAGILNEFKPSGFTAFHRMPSGAWIVSEWQLRMPRLERGRNGLFVSAYVERGGKVTTVADESAKQRQSKK